VEALTDRDGKQANTVAKKEEMLRGESFPLNDGHQYYELLPAGQAHKCITEQSVKRALFSQSVKKAPGPGKRSSGAVQLLCKLTRTRIVEETKSAVQMGHHPAVWKCVSVVVIRISGMENYKKLTSYRMICLLSRKGKIVQKVVAELLPDKAERRALLSNGQFSSRENRSAIDAAAIMVKRALSAWKYDNLTGVQLRDIKEAFPNLSRGRLIHAMKAQKIDGDLIQWTESILIERMVEMVIEGNILQSRCLQAGVPQVVLAMVPDHHFRSRSGSKPNCGKIGGPGHQ